MAKIKILPDNIANKIAAGEVVQRPESVVKELMENSIDAGANTIEVAIKRAGKSLVQVCDNGTGMNEEDALLCVQKHATSKIFTFNDLESISTLGFRGEALSSVSAVAQVEIKTETREEEIGTLIRVEDGTTIVKEKGSFSKGTCVAVKNLFFNLPARRNFLKSDATELKHIVDTFNRLALSHYDLSFKFFNDDQLIYNYGAGDLKSKIRQVFADNMTDALIPVEERTEFLTVYGFIGNPTMLKKSKGDQYFFLNTRYVISRPLSHAVFTAYENFLEKGDYPFFILFIDIDPRRTDVNVHPSKLEVRFDDEKDVYNFILAVVKKSLGTHDLVPDMMLTNPDDQSGKADTDNDRRADNSDISDRSGFREQISYSKTSFTDKEIDMIFKAIPDDVIGVQPGEEIHGPFDEKQDEVYHELSGERGKVITEEPVFIIQLHNKYILSQIKTGLMVIDQCTAHERILYEKALKRIDANLPFSQQLLFAKSLNVDPDIFSVMKEIHPYLVKLGFIIRFSGKSTVIIEGVPEDAKQDSEEEVLIELIKEFIGNNKEKDKKASEKIAQAYSHTAAIKAGERLSEKAMRLLIDQLFATSMPYVSPHGRPTVAKISLEEFDRRFGR